MYWSDQLVPECPHKITVTSKGTGRKVKVTGQGLKGGFVGQELRVIVDTTEAGYGKTLEHNIHINILIFGIVSISIYKHSHFSAIG